MRPPLAKRPNAVPWRNEEEWLDVMNSIYPQKYAVYDSLNFELDFFKAESAIRMMEKWKDRCHQLPSSIEATLNLLYNSVKITKFLAERKSTCTFNESEASSECSHKILQLSAAMAIVRFVNSMVDPQQKSVYAKPITVLADGIDLPRTLVDLRHECTHHSELPSLEYLKYGMFTGLKWLFEVYWSPSSKWRESLERLCNDVFSEIAIDFQQCCQNSNNMLQSDLTSTLSKIIAKRINSIDFIGYSIDVQKVFLHTLFTRHDFSCHDILYHSVIKTLVGWAPNVLPIAFFDVFMKEEISAVNMANIKFASLTASLNPKYSLTCIKYFLKKCIESSDDNICKKKEFILSYIYNIPVAVEEDNLKFVNLRRIVGHIVNHKSNSGVFSSTRQLLEPVDTVEYVALVDSHPFWFRPTET